MTNLEQLYVMLRSSADAAAASAQDYGVEDVVNHQFHTGRQSAFLTVLHILEDDFGVRLDVPRTIPGTLEEAQAVNRAAEGEED